MQNARHWSDFVTAEDLGGFDPVLERLREAARPLRLSWKQSEELCDLGALFELLQRATGRVPRIHAPGCPDRSFDESWICAVFAARKRGDARSYRFLLQSRMSREKASEAHFLICRAQLSLDSF